MDKFHNRLQVALLIALAAAMLSRCAPYDETDAPPVRSGLVIRTDHGTGCQYLGRPFGGITHRLDGSGKHVGCRITL